MKAVRFEITFSLEARTIGSEDKRVILSNMTLLSLRTSRGKESESDLFMSNKFGLHNNGISNLC